MRNKNVNENMKNKKYKQIHFVRIKAFYILFFFPLKKSSKFDIKEKDGWLDLHNLLVLISELVKVT